VETHRQQLMNKLKLHNVADLVRYSIREGLSPLER
jgi:DNA-binding NarL/FixJ family response regulator